MHSPGRAHRPRAAAFCLVLLAGNGKSYARQADIDTVKAAVAAYHAALGSLDPQKWPRSGRLLGPSAFASGERILGRDRDRAAAVGTDYW
jgi:hypothetical protein